ncbi:MAG: hypothetical protein V2I48_00655 [Xanthomonadales bacterium]|jgi:hypothetical protein|nr:hypothetical protein [Xanthomonadales bacterium]
MTHDDRHEGADEQLEAMLQQLEIEKAPASLSSRLYRIPEEESNKGWKWPWQWFSNPMPQWVMAPALAAVPLIVLAIFLVQDRGPSEAEVEQARRDLAVAFAYMDKAGVITGAEIQNVLGSELRNSVKKPLSEHMPFTEQFRKEETS